MTMLYHTGKILVALLCFPLMSLGQATQRVAVKREQPQYYTEAYSVMKADGRTRHGAYAKNGLLNRALVRGYYRNGQKDSIWTFYYTPSGKMQSRGRYRAGQKAGLWEYWHSNGERAFNYDHTHNTLELRPLPADTLSDSWEMNMQKKELREPPRFVGGDETRWFGGDGRVRYPDAALKHNVSGRVVVEYIVDERGNASGFRVVESRHPALDQEALRVAHLVFDNWWLPATLNGRPCKTTLKMPLTFRIN